MGQEIVSGFEQGGWSHDRYKESYRVRTLSKVGKGMRNAEIQSYKKVERIGDFTSLNII